MLGVPKFMQIQWKGPQNHNNNGDPQKYLTKKSSTVPKISYELKEHKNLL